MKKIIFAAVLISLFYPARSQKIITLWQCYDSAAVTTPLSGERDLYSQLSSLKDRNLSTAWLPELNLNGSYSYQSDVVDMSDILSSLPIPPGTLPSIPHDQYRAYVDVSQVIWDGGVTRSARNVEQVVRDLNMQQNEADIYRLREQVSNYFFSSLLASAQIEVTGLLLSDLDARINETRSGVSNGVISPVTLDVLRAEKIKTEQALCELRRRHEAFLKVLEQITGMADLKDAVLALPEITITGDEKIANPEIRLFDVRRRQLEVSDDLLRNQRMPKAFAFAQAGYGNPPGNNFLSENADFYYSFGAGIKWNIFDWDRNRNDRKSLALQRQLIDIRQNATEESLQRLLAVRMAEIISLREAAMSDEELIRIRRKITEAAASQLENGTITASQYLTELNSEKQAILNAAIRKIGISRAEAEYLNITGNNK